MPRALKQNVIVQSGGLIEIRSPELPPGSSAEVIILLEESKPDRPFSRWLGAAPGCYSSPQEATDFLREERDQWES